MLEASNHLPEESTAQRYLQCKAFDVQGRRLAIVNKAGGSKKAPEPL